MPILKSDSKRRSRCDLSTQMISAPLADFRHTMHIGRGGDAFGDTSFLGAPTEPPAQVQVAQNKNGMIAHNMRGSKHSVLEEKHSPASLTPDVLQTNCKKDMSLHPLRTYSSSFSGTNGHERQSLANKNQDQNFKEACDPREDSTPLAAALKNAESILSFHIDLGPSMLGDVLSVMDLNCQDRNGHHQENCWEDPLPLPVHDQFSSKQVSKNEKKQNTNNRSTRGAPPSVMSNSTHCGTGNHTPSSKYISTYSTKLTVSHDTTSPNVYEMNNMTSTSRYDITPASMDRTYKTASAATTRDTYSTTAAALYNATPASTYNIRHAAAHGASHKATPAATNITTPTATPRNAYNIRPASTPAGTCRAALVETYNIRPSATHNSTYNTTPSAKYSTTPAETYNIRHSSVPATYSTTPAARYNIRTASTHSDTPATSNRAVPVSTHKVVNVAKNTATPAATYSATPVPTDNIRPASMYSVRPSSTYNTTCNATPVSICYTRPETKYNDSYNASTHNLLPYNGTRSSTQITPGIASFDDEDFLFMDEDEDDDEIRL